MMNLPVKSWEVSLTSNIAINSLSDPALVYRILTLNDSYSRKQSSTERNYRDRQCHNLCSGKQPGRLPTDLIGPGYLG